MAITVPRHRKKWEDAAAHAVVDESGSHKTARTCLSVPTAAVRKRAAVVTLYLCIYTYSRLAFFSISRGTRRKFCMGGPFFIIKPAASYEKSTIWEKLASTSFLPGANLLMDRFGKGASEVIFPTNPLSSSSWEREKNQENSALCCYRRVGGVGEKAWVTCSAVSWVLCYSVCRPPVFFYIVHTEPAACLQQLVGAELENFSARVWIEGRLRALKVSNDTLLSSPASFFAGIFPLYGVFKTKCRKITADRHSVERACVNPCRSNSPVMVKLCQSTSRTDVASLLVWNCDFLALRKATFFALSYVPAAVNYETNWLEATNFSGSQSANASAYL